jgi:hypothetical protein
MVPYAVVFVMAAAGCLGLPAWVVLLGAAGVVSEGWWTQAQRLHRHPRQLWSKKTTAYFVTGILANLAVSAAGYGIGRAARAAAGW